MHNLFNRVADLVNKRRPEIIEQLKRCIEFNTVNPPGNEGPLARYVGTKMQSIGAEVSYQEVFPGRPNVLCSFKFSEHERCLLWNTHMDTVPIGTVPWAFEPWSGHEQDGKVYGRGACDAKGSLASMMGALQVLSELGVALEGELLFAPVIWEEGGGKGTQHFVNTGMAGRKPVAAVVGEPTECLISTAHRGSNRRKVVVHGVAAHSSDPDKGVNSIYRAARLLLEIERLHEQLRSKQHELLGSPVVSANVVSGGQKHDTIPDRTEIVIDRRRIPGEPKQQLDNEIRTIVERLRRDDPGYEYEIIDLDMDKEPAETERTAEIVKKAAQVVRTMTGKDAVLTAQKGGTDMTFLVNDAHVPTIIYGPGGLGMPHAVDEYVPVEHILTATVFYSLLAVSVLGGENAC